MIKLFTDSDTDMTPQDCEKYGYTMISMPYIINDEAIYPYKDFEVFDSKSFYNSLRNGLLPTTCALNPEEYKAYFEPVFKEGNDILYVHFSAAMSGTFNSMRIAIDELKEKYPQRKFYTIDTKGITICSYNIVKAVGDLYLEGKSIEEILKWAETEVDKFTCYFYADDLKFFRRSGRVSGIAATMGSLLLIKPIIYMGSDGKMVNIGKERGQKNALNKLMSYIDNLQENMKDYRIIIGHSDSLDLAKKLGDLITQKYGNDLLIEYVVVNPTAGSHCGPNAIGISFHGKHR